MGRHAGSSDGVRAVFGGGREATGGNHLSSRIEYITIASEGNASDFGTLTIGRGFWMGTSTPTRGVFAGGRFNAHPVSDLNNIIDDIDNPFECYAVGCNWEQSNNIPGGGSCFEVDDDGEDDEGEDEDYYCEGLSQDECFLTEGCQWYENEGCYRSEEENDFEDECRYFQSEEVDAKNSNPLGS